MKSTYWMKQNIKFLMIILCIHDHQKHLLKHPFICGILTFIIHHHVWHSNLGGDFLSDWFSGGPANSISTIWELVRNANSPVPLLIIQKLSRGWSLAIYILNKPFRWFGCTFQFKNHYFEFCRCQLSVK